MKTTIAFPACLVVIACFSIGQTMAQSMLSLSNYTYSPTKTTIGTLRTSGSVAGFTVKGSTASSFNLDKSGQLTIKSQAAKSNEPWYDVIIEGKGNSGVQRDTFRVVKDQFIRNLVIAHRGAWKQSATSENSLTSLKNAVALGCMGSEFDVHMSQDSVLFVNHDPVIQGLAIEKTPSAELANVKLSNGESLPTLEAYLREGMKQTKTRLILEIKTSTMGKERSMALTERVLKMVHDLKAQAWVDYIAFDYDVCKKVKALDPDAKVAYLTGDKTPAQLAADHLYGLDYHYNIIKKNEAWIAEAQQQHLTVNVWTVNDRPTLTYLLEHHVDFITTNEPEMLLEMIK
jgi:glycerophosphoryl diester phosphodiesterase